MTRKRLPAALAATIVAGAIAAPAAPAQSTDLHSPDAQDLATRAERTQHQDLRSPDTRDFAEHRRIVASIPVRVTEYRYVSRSGFDAADAAVGAAGMLGVILLGTGGTALVVRRRREPSDMVPAS